MGPIRSGGARGNGPHQGPHELTLPLGFLLFRAQVLDQRLVEDPVHRLAVLAAGLDEVAGGAVEQPGQILGAVAARRGERGGHAGPQFVGGQPGPLGVGDGPQQIPGPGLVVAEAGQVVIECLPDLGREPLPVPPSGHADIDDWLVGPGAGRQPGDQEVRPRRLGDRRRDLPARAGVGAVAAGQVRVEVGPQARRGVVGQVVPVEPGRVIQPVDHRPLTERCEQLLVPSRPGPGEYLHAQVAGQRHQQLAGDVPRRPCLVQRVQHHHQAAPLGRVKIPDSSKHILHRCVGGHGQRQCRCQRPGGTAGVQAAGPHRGRDPACCRDGGRVGQCGRAGCGDLGAQLGVAERAQPRQHRRLAGPGRAGHHPHRPARRAIAPATRSAPAAARSGR